MGAHIISALKGIIESLISVFSCCGIRRHHVFVKTSHREVQLAEVGPRFEMRPYEIRQGTVEQSEADVEWQLRPFMNTARKRNQL